MFARVQHGIEQLADAILEAARPHVEHGRAANHMGRAFHGAASVAIMWTGA